MKRWVGVGVVVAAVGSVLVWGWQHLQAKDRGKGSASPVLFPTKSKDTRPPKIVLSQRKHNFGSMDQEEDGTHQFEIRNEGSGVLLLQFREKTCGCTGLRIEDLVWTKDQKTPPREEIEVPPGENTHLEFAWNTELRTNLRTSAKLVTNDPEEPVVEFMVEGEVIPSVELSQRQVTVADMRNNESSTVSLDVFSRSMENLEITEMESSQELVTATWTAMSTERLEAMSAKSGYRATVQIAPGHTLGPFRATLTVHTNSERRPKLTVDITGKVTGDVMLTPWDSLDFMTVKVSEGRTLGLFVFVKARGETDHKAKIARVNPEFLKVQLVRAGKGPYELKVEVPPGAPGGKFWGSIELETSHPTAKVVKIPVRGEVIQ